MVHHVSVLRLQTAPKAFSQTLSHRNVEKLASWPHVSSSRPCPTQGPKPTSLPPHPPFRRLRFRIAPPRPRPSPSSSSRPLLRRVAALLGGRVRASHRLLSSSPSSSSAAAAATERASPPSPADPDTVHMTDGCIRVCPLTFLPFVHSLKIVSPVFCVEYRHNRRFLLKTFGNMMFSV